MKLTYEELFDLSLDIISRYIILKDEHKSLLDLLKTKKKAINKLFNQHQPKSKYIGSSYHKNSGKYESRIRINGQRLHLGYYKEDIMAAKAYTIARKKQDLFNGNAKEFREMIKKDLTMLK